MPNFPSSSEHLPSSSSTRYTQAPPSSATLRARLLSEETPTISPPGPEHPDMYKQFKAYFETNPPSKELTVPTPPKDDDATKLQEAFAQQGMNLHASAMESLVEAHSEIQSKIDAFAEESSTTLAQCDALYDNISYPLSATLCHSDTLPRATIETHLTDLRKEIASALEEIKVLGEEWDACNQTEAELWKELTEKKPRKGMDAETKRMMEVFKQEARDIVEAKSKELTKIEQEFKVKIQAEMTTLMKIALDEDLDE